MERKKGRWHRRHRAVWLDADLMELVDAAAKRNWLSIREQVELLVALGLSQDADHGSAKGGSTGAIQQERT
jgi:hypothetical protein